MPSRPEVTLVLPRRCHPGDTIDVKVSLEGGTPDTPIARASLALRGRIEVEANGNRSVPVRATFFEQTLQTWGKGTLGPDRSFTATASVPSHVPPSYVGALLTIRYEVSFHVDIPWWLDVDEVKELAVVASPSTRRAAEPVRSRSAGGDLPVVEVTLDDTRFGPGDTVTGALALANVGARAVETAEVALIGKERWLVDGRWGTSEAHRLGLRQVTRPVEGKAHAFQLAIPAAVTPSFDTANAGLSWSIEIRLEPIGVALADRALTHDVPIELAVLPRRRQPAKGPRLDIGWSRWRAGWQSVGEQRGLQLDPDELVLRGSIAGAGVAISLASKLGERAGLAAELDFTPLGLGLRLQRRGLDFFGIDLGDPAFGKRFVVRGREATQVRALLSSALRRALLAFDAVTLDDGSAHLRSRTLGPDAADLTTFLPLVEAFAAALAAAPRVPPAAMETFVPAWRSFAEHGGGRLDVGGMAVRDARESGEPFELVTVFEEEPTPLRTVLRLLVPQLRDVIDLGDPEVRARLPERVDAAVGALRQRVQAVRLVAGAVEVEVEAPLPDPAVLRPAMADMLALLPWLRGERRGGPYR